MNTSSNQVPITHQSQPRSVRSRPRRPDQQSQQQISQISHSYCAVDVIVSDHQHTLETTANVRRANRHQTLIPLLATC